ncbi:MAG: ABC1 kinase family protein [Candidatus Nanohalobium sp.]
MNHLKGDIKKVERLEEVVGILFRQQLGYIIEKLDLDSRLPIHKRLRAKRHSKPAPERLRETFEELGTVFIKFGQILSERPDLIPEEYCDELSKLQNSVQGFHPDEAKKIVDEEVGLENFDRFKEKPLAAASIAQVHKARLEDGREVVVKIRRPGIREEVERDLDILLYLAKKADKHIDLGENFIYNEVKEFAEWTREELDFKNERRNIEEFRENMRDEENVRVPEPYGKYCTDKVLTMEYVDAVKCDNVENIQAMEVDEEEVARTGIRSVLKQILRDGLLHADPHPSNFMVDNDGNLVFLDFGMMTRITEKTQRELGMMMLQISNEDIDGVMETIERLSRVEDDADLDTLQEEVQTQILKMRNTTIQEQSVSKVIIKTSMKAAQCGVYLPTRITLIGKGFLTMEGIGLKIYPEFKPQESYREQVEKLLIEQNNPQTMMKNLALNLIQNQDVITKLPEKINHNLETGISGEHRHEVKVDSTKTPLIPILLIGSSTLLITGSVISRELLYIGLAELAIGLYLYRQSN